MRQIYSMMGVADKIGTTITPEMRAKLNNIDNALKLQDFKKIYVADFEKPFLEVSGIAMNHLFCSEC